MNRFVKILLKRFLNMLFSIMFALMLIILLVYLMPGKNYYSILNPNMSSELIHKLEVGNEFSLLTASLNFIGNLFSGNLGSSIHYHQNISVLIYEHLSVTALIALSAFIIQFVVSVFLAYLSIRRRGKIFGKIMNKLAAFFYSVPTIVTAPILIILFSVTLKIFPISGYSNFSASGNFIEIIYYLTLPILSLILSFIPEYYLYFVEILSDIYNKNFIIHLRSIGVSEKKIFLNHVIPNSFNSILSIAGIDLGFLLTGALITEVIFGIPGFGRLTYEAIWTKDYYLAISCGLYGSIIFIVINFISDLIRFIIDKRTLSSVQ
ncbi:MAG: ABC transporter permease [Ignavibacteriales bacterium]